MTEEEKMDKKMRAVAKKSSDGAPAPKPKATPKADTGGPPQAGTLQVTDVKRHLRWQFFVTATATVVLFLLATLGDSVCKVA